MKFIDQARHQLTAICTAIPHGKEFRRTHIELYKGMVLPAWRWSATKVEKHLRVKHPAAKVVLTAGAFILLVPCKDWMLVGSLVLPIGLKISRTRKPGPPARDTDGPNP